MEQLIVVAHPNDGARFDEGIFEQPVRFQDIQE